MSGLYLVRQGIDQAALAAFAAGSNRSARREQWVISAMSAPNGSKGSSGRQMRTPCNSGAEKSLPSVVRT